MASHKLDRLTSTQKKRRAAFHIAENLSRQINCGIGHRDRVFANGGIRAHFLCDPEGFRENQIQVKSNGSRLLRHGKGRLHLPEDLGFSEYHGIQTGSDPDQVRGGGQPMITVNRGS